MTKTLKTVHLVVTGVFKFRPDDLTIIIQRLVDELTPRVAITLYPALPAYILFKCIRYTDLINADDCVRNILTLFLTSVKKFYRTQSPVDVRLLWHVNMIK